MVDEFSELLAAKPEFIDLFVMIGRLGRSLGVHLLLASQRLEEGRLRGLDTQLSYRIGLRTFSAAESRIVLGVPDAYELPSAPGSGYLKIDTTGMTRFKAAYVSGPAETDAAAQPPSPRRYQAMVVPYGARLHQPREIPAAGAAPGVQAGRPANPAEANPGDARLGDQTGPGRRQAPGGSAAGKPARPWWSASSPGRARPRTRSGCHRWASHPP